MSNVGMKLGTTFKVNTSFVSFKDKIEVCNEQYLSDTDDVSNRRGEEVFKITNVTCFPE